MSRTMLVLLPGLLNTRRVFEHQITALSDIADCIVPELWHHDTMGAMADAALAAAPASFPWSASRWAATSPSKSCAVYRSGWNGWR